MSNEEIISMDRAAIALFLIVVTLSACTGKAPETATTTTLARVTTSTTYPARLDAVSGVALVGANLHRTGVYDTEGPALGKLKWKFKTGERQASPPVVFDGIVYVGGWNSSFYALDAETGGVIWEFVAGDKRYSEAVVADGIVYSGGTEGYMYALDAKTGKEKWRFKVDGYRLPVPGGALFDDVDSPVVYSGVIYFSSNDGNLYAVDSTTGRLLWKYNTESIIFSFPIISGGLVYFDDGSGGDARHIFALDAKTGQERWQFTTLSGAIYLSLDSGILYAGGWGDKLYAIDAATGEQLWVFSTGTRNYFGTIPAVYNGMVYAGSSNGYLYALDAITGEKIWEYETLGGFHTPEPSIAGGVLYFVDGLRTGETVDGTFVEEDWNVLHAIDTETGEEKWTSRIAGEAGYERVVYIADGTAYFVGKDGYVYAVR